MEIYGIVYLITNLLNGKIYVGQTIFSEAKRWRDHVYYAMIENGAGYLQNAIRHYKPESFKVEKICIAFTKEQLDQLEEFYIQSLRSFDPEIGYNQVLGVPRDKTGRTKAGEKQLGILNHYYRHDLVDSELIELYASGMTISKIAEKFQASTGIISKRLRDKGVKVARQPGKRKDIPEEELCELYKSGISVSRLTTKYSVARDTILRVLRENDIRPREYKSHPTDNKSTLFKSHAPTEEMVDLYSKGISAKDIATSLKVCPSTVKRRLEIAGVKLRSPKEAQLIANKTSKSGETTSICRSDIDVQSLVKDYLSGESIVNLASIYKAGSMTIRRRLKEAGVYRKNL